MEAVKRQVVTVVTATLVIAALLSVGAVEFVAASGANDDGNLGNSGNQGGPPTKAISFVAFCVDGTIDAEEVTTLEVTAWKDGDEPIEVSWKSAVEVSTVVIKAGPSITNFAGGTMGDARVGEGSPSTAAQTPPSPCPEGETGVKFEWEDDEFVVDDD